MNVNAGERIDDYTISRTLGHGGMSDVFLARDEAHNRDVVLKFPHDDMLGDPAAYERFSREVKIGGLLTHPHIQKLYALAGGVRSPYLVLEYVDGVTLRERMNADAPFAVEKAVALGAQIADALAYAHSCHVFHRDLKPENVIITPDDTAKVMDFGIAFVEGARRITWGRLSSQVGTPDYMSPEQVRGNRGDARTDIYALGIIIYEMLAGRPPFQGDNALAVMNQHVTANPPPLHRFTKHIPPALEEVVMKAIRRDPAGRWPTMADFGTALRQPDTTDTAALKIEREAQEGRNTTTASINNPFGFPIWQAALILGVFFLAVIAIGVIAQLLHH